MLLLRRSILSALSATLILITMTTTAAITRADDGMFPAAPAARPSIDFTARGFLVHGRPEFIVSGSMHYPRVPRALWRDRLMRIRSAGFNCVETYAFWNLHEPREGKWEFGGDKDLDAFLKEIKALGMYAIVRLGPYVCAEWDSGGYPVWLRFKPGVKVREPNEPFQAAVDRWYEKVIPIVAANQIHRGGAVIMVQLENEHPLGWGREMPNAYFRRLREKAVSLGLEVPYFFSGLHHGSDPAGNTPWDSKGRDNPWFSTEFWPGWYDLYGPLSDSRYTGFVRGTWKIIAYGGNGYNFYMLHGGTDFDTWNDDEVTSSYDYAAAIGQAGDLRPIYYAFKQAALFARSFSSILENSENTTLEYQGAATSAGLRVTARKSPDGSIVFLDNDTGSAVETRVHFADGAPFPDRPIVVAAHEIRPIVRNVTLIPGVQLESCSARILGIASQQGGALSTIVVFGPPGKGVGVDRVDVDERGEPVAELRFVGPNRDVELPIGHARAGAEVTTESDGGRCRVTVVASLGQPGAGHPFTTTQFGLAGHRIRIVAMPYEMAQRTWFIGPRDQQTVVCGPEYVEGFAGNARGAAPSIVAEATAQRGYSRPVLASQFPTTVFGDDDSIESYRVADAALSQALERGSRGDQDPFAKEFQAPALSEWEVRPADREASPEYFPAKWKFGLNPPPMGSDGDTSAYAWYRTTVHAQKAGPVTLAFSDAGDWITVFVNGARVGSSKIAKRFSKPAPREIPAALRAGDNTIAVFAAHYGRHKLFNHLGPIDTIDVKGLGGPVYITQDAPVSRTVEAWRWRPAAASEAGLDRTPAHSDTGAAGWSDARIGEDVFRKQRGFAWFHALLPRVPGRHVRIHFDGVDDNATVFLNGRRLTQHRGWDDPFDVKLDPAWKASGDNELLVLVENTANTGGIIGRVEVSTDPAGSGTPIQGWRERGGIDDPTSDRGWQPLREVRGPGVPALYRAEFTGSPLAPAGARPGLRLATVGLSRGFVWLNGHNLGRYPEKTPAPGIYLPECWLKKGRNTLTLFDEEGSSPLQAHLTVEAEASRVSVELVPMYGSR
jgi:beta-galactosidase